MLSLCLPYTLSLFVCVSVLEKENIFRSYERSEGEGKALFRLISITRRDVFLSLEVFVFEGQKMKFTMSMLLTCILYCDTWRGRD